MTPDLVPNAHEWSVTELAGAMRRTLEDAFGYVKLKGEISGYRGPSASGHVYFSIKDEGAKIDAVIWKGSFSRLKMRPQEGLEVVATGKITTFANKSSYQIVVETLAPAGVGALMALLEERRRKLQAEGLFDPARRKPLPYLPRVIGVVTSPTGAVIRDILHRLDDRFPRHVLVWPVRVQGESSAEEVAAGIRGFNAMEPGGSVPRPDVIIVARGGGSIEDLWSFNEEAVVRAAAESVIPLVSAVGHETDTTLLDRAADMRAPTPTGAAEMVVPVRAELLTAVADLARRRGEAALRLVEHRRVELRSVARSLPRGEELFAEKRRRLDLSGSQLPNALLNATRKLQIGTTVLVERLLRSSPLARLEKADANVRALDDRRSRAHRQILAAKRQLLEQKGRELAVAMTAFQRIERQRIVQRRDKAGVAGERLPVVAFRQLERKRSQLETLCQLFDSLNYKSVLARGYALVRDPLGRPLRSAAAIAPGLPMALEFADGSVTATADGGAAPRVARRARPTLVAQGTLFDA